MPMQKPFAPRWGSWAWIELKLALAFSFGARGRARWYRQLARLIEGSNIVYAIENLARIQRRDRDVMAALLDVLLGRLQSQHFSNALAGWVPDAEIAILVASEANGRLQQGLLDAAFLAEKSAERQAIMVSAALMPAIGIVLVIGITLFVAWVQVPVMVKVLPLEKWPAESKMIHDIAMDLADGLWWVLGAVLAIVMLVLWSLSRWAMFGRSVADAVPFSPWQVYRDAESAGFVMALITLCSSGIDLATALARLRIHARPYTHHHLSLMLARLTALRPVHEVWKTGLLPRWIRIELEVFGQRGLDESVGPVGKILIEDLLVRLRAQVSMAVMAITLLVLGYSVAMYFGLSLIPLEVLQQSTNA